MVSTPTTVFSDHCYLIIQLYQIWPEMSEYDQINLLKCILMGGKMLAWTYSDSLDARHPR